MAHSNSRSRRGSYTEGGRDNDYHVSKWRHLPLSSYPARAISTAKKIRTVLQSYEDRRRFMEQGTPRTIYQPVRFKVGPVRFTGQRYRSFDHLNKQWMKNVNVVPSRIDFVDPKNVLICIRRKIRRQVLHALKIAGGSGMKKPTFNEYSKVHC